VQKGELYPDRTSRCILLAEFNEQPPESATPTRHNPKMKAEPTITRALVVVALLAGLVGATTRTPVCAQQNLDSVSDRLSLTPKYAADEAPAPAEGGDSAELAKELSNPVASLISVPFQFNYDTGFGPKDADKLTLNIQPVIPIPLNEDWNLIVRTIVPIVYQDSIADGIDSKFGLGDAVQSFFFSPKAPTAGGWIWGAGPVFLWPTATDDSLGAREWGAGPTAVLLKQDHGFTYGILANHIWSYASAGGSNEVNATFVQPFITYTWPTATTIGINTESTYDWTSSQWNVPINLFVSQIVKFGKQPVQFSVGPRYYAESPDGGPEWGVRFTVTFLFPK
jgi:hypothetical protein